MMNSANSTSNATGVSHQATSLVATLVAVMTICVAGIMAIDRATCSFRVVSTEDGRRLEIALHPRQIPKIDLTTVDGQVRDLKNGFLRDGRVAIVSFMYTRCNSICSVLGGEFQQMQRAIEEQHLDSQVRLISISFDTKDSLQDLRFYASQLDAKPKIWTFYGLESAQSLQSLLDTFGIVVVALPNGDFQHNAAFHIVTPDGRLQRIFDYNQPDAAVQFALWLARQQSNNLPKRANS